VIADQQHLVPRTGLDSFYRAHLISVHELIRC
jgi:hypothetical protein